MYLRVLCFQLHPESEYIELIHYTYLETLCARMWPKQTFIKEVGASQAWRGKNGGMFCKKTKKTKKTQSLNWACPTTGTGTQISAHIE